MKVLFAFIVLLGMISCFSIGAYKCTEDDQIDCVDDVRAAFPYCQKAAQEGGSDTEADLQCIKYFNALKSKCWPCICVIAALDHVTVKGC